MSKTTTNLDCPVLSLLTSEELHRAIIRLELTKQNIADPDAFLKENSVESKVQYRNVRQPNGQSVMMAAVCINSVTPKTPLSQDPNNTTGDPNA